MSDQSEMKIKAALYTAVMNKLNGELSELEAKEILLVPIKFLLLQVLITLH